MQDELLAHAKLLQQYRPRLGRPLVDTLSGSRHSNMKELRFTWRSGHWRIAFAFLLDVGHVASQGINVLLFYQHRSHHDQKLDFRMRCIQRSLTWKESSDLRKMTCPIPRVFFLQPR